MSARGMKKSTKIAIFSFIVIIKIAQVVWLNNISHSYNPELSFSKLAIIGGDTKSYIEPFKNLKNTGEYFNWNEKKTEKIYAGRMPAYGLLYYTLCFIKNDKTVFSIYVLLQIIIEALAILLFTNIILKHTNKVSLYYFALLLLTFSLQHTHWTRYILPESLGLSILMIIIYLFYKLKEACTYSKLILLSALCTFLTFLKPYIGILFVIIGLYLILSNSKSLNWLKYNLVLGSILFITILPWNIRNYIKTKEIIPLTESYSGYFMPNSMIELRKFIGNFGESSEPWDKKAMASYFYSYPGSIFSEKNIPKSKGYSNYELIELKNYFTQLNPNNFDNTKDKNISNRLIKYRKSYKKENTILVTLISPLKLLKKYLFHSGSYYLPINLGDSNTTVFQKLYKYLQSLIHYLLVSLGFIGLLLKRDWFLLSIPIFLIVLFCFVFKVVELRFFLYMYPFLIIGMLIVIENMWKKNRYVLNKKNI